MGSRALAVLQAGALALPPGVAPYLSRLVLLRRLLSLRLSPSLGNARRCQELLEDVAETARVAGGYAFTLSARALALSLHLTRLQALLRGGNVVGALAAAAEGSSVLRGLCVCEAAVAHARLLRVLGAARSAAGSWLPAPPAPKKQAFDSDGAAPPPPHPLQLRFPGAFHFERALPPELPPGAIVKCVVGALGWTRDKMMLREGPAAAQRARGLLWAMRVALAAEGAPGAAAPVGGGRGRGGDRGGAGEPRAAALGVLKAALAETLPPPVEALPRLAFIAVARAHPGVSAGELAAALGPSLAPEAHARAARALIDAAAVPPALLRGALESSVASPAGARCVALWLQFLRLEAAAPLAPPPDVRARALRALQGEDAAAFVEAAAKMAAGAGVGGGR
jgi:hypothetical protein